MAKKKIDVRKHSRELPSGEVTSVKKHKREIEKVEISKSDKAKIKRGKATKIKGSDPFKETISMTKSPMVKVDSGYTVHYRYTTTSIQNAKSYVKKVRKNGYPAYYYRGSMDKKPVYRVYVSDEQDLRYYKGPKETMEKKIVESKAEKLHKKKSPGYLESWEFGELEKKVDESLKYWWKEPGEAGALQRSYWQSAANALDDVKKDPDKIKSMILLSKKKEEEWKSDTTPNAKTNRAYWQGRTHVLEEALKVKEGKESSKLKEKSVEELALQGYKRLLKDPNLDEVERKLYKQKIEKLTGIIKSEKKKKSLLKPKAKKKSITDLEHERSKLMLRFNELDVILENTPKGKKGNELSKESKGIAGRILEIDKEIKEKKKPKPKPKPKVKSQEDLIKEIKGDIGGFSPGYADAKDTDYDNDSITISFKNLGQWDMPYEDADYEWAEGEWEKYDEEFKDWAKKQDWWDPDRMIALSGPDEKAWAGFEIRVKEPVLTVPIPDYMEYKIKGKRTLYKKESEWDDKPAALVSAQMARDEGFKARVKRIGDKHVVYYFN